MKQDPGMYGLNPQQNHWLENICAFMNFYIAVPGYNEISNYSKGVAE